MKTNRLTLLTPALLFACGGESAILDGDGPSDSTALVRNIDQGDSVATQVDASDQEAWVYVDLDAGREAVRLEVEDPGAVPEWDIAFRRSNMKLNGGHSGPGSVAVAPLPGADFASTSEAPVAVYRVDEPATGEVDSERPSFIDDDGTDFAIGRPNDASPNGWFDYDPVNHVLSPAGVVFALRSSEGAYFKLRFLDYYSEVGSSGYPSFRWAPIAAPDDAPVQFEIDASSREDFVYVSLDQAEIVSVDDPSGSTDWDLAFRRTLIRANGGASGPGLGGGREAIEADGDHAGTTGFGTDVLLPPPGPPVPMDQWTPANEALSAWFDYNPATRSVSPRDAEFLARSSHGQTFRYRIDAWEDGRFTLTRWPVPSLPRVASNIMEASSDWTYFSLRAGAVVEPERPEESLDWDVAFRDGVLRTNGGDSGPGQAAVQSTGETDMRALVTAPAEGYVPDQGGQSGVMMEGAGSGEVFALRLADGSFGKLTFEQVEEGRVEFAFAFAGPGTRSFR
jgi:hypothetical protein